MNHPLDRIDIERRVAHANEMLHAHAGGLELIGVEDSGVVHVRFTGMCTGCLYKPVTMAATVRQLLMEAEGVTAVEAEGSRISAEAEARMAYYLAPEGTYPAHLPPLPVVT